MAFRRVMSVIVLVSFVFTLFTFPVKAQSISDLPVPGTMVNLSPAFNPVIIKGLKINPQNPFAFDFIIDQGDSSLPLVGRAREGGQQEQLKTQANKLIKYFLAAMTIPENDLWVNLSPYEKDRTLPEALGQTEMGRDMLAQDYLLKQLTASMIYPEKELGQKFWDKIYAQAQKQYGPNVQIPINTFNKVWIVADKADIFERGNVAYIVNAHLKVMLEEDYLATAKNSPPLEGGARGGVSKVSPPPSLPHQGGGTMSSQVIRDIILPELEREVNQGQNFAPLRQMFYSMILASWYKMALKDALLTQVYGNQNKVTGLLDLSSPNASIGDPDAIYQRYLEAYKKGVFNYIKEDIVAGNSKPMPRKYFSGGVALMPNPAQLIQRHATMPVNGNLSGNFAMVSGAADFKKDSAMMHYTKVMTKSEISQRVAEIGRAVSSSTGLILEPIGQGQLQVRFFKFPNKTLDVTGLTAFTLFSNKFYVAHINSENNQPVFEAINTQSALFNKVQEELNSDQLPGSVKEAFGFRDSAPNAAMTAPTIYFNYRPPEKRIDMRMVAASLVSQKDGVLKVRIKRVRDEMYRYFEGREVEIRRNHDSFGIKFPKDYTEREIYPVLMHLVERLPDSIALDTPSKLFKHYIRLRTDALKAPGLQPFVNDQNIIQEIDNVLIGALKEEQLNTILAQITQIETKQVNAAQVAYIGKKPNGLNFKIYPTPERVSYTVANEIATTIEENNSRGEKSVVILFTGRRGEAVSHELVKIIKERNIDLKLSKFFYLDEYYMGMPKGKQKGFWHKDPRSYHFFSRKNFINLLNADGIERIQSRKNFINLLNADGIKRIQESQVYVLDGEGMSTWGSIAEYDKQLNIALREKRESHPEAEEKIDIIGAGSGSEGHVAFIEKIIPYVKGMDRTEIRNSNKFFIPKSEDADEVIRKLWEIRHNLRTDHQYRKDLKEGLERRANENRKEGESPIAVDDAKLDKLVQTLRGQRATFYVEGLSAELKEELESEFPINVEPAEKMYTEFTAEEELAFSTIIDNYSDFINQIDEMTGKALTTRFGTILNRSKKIVVAAFGNKATHVLGKTSESPGLDHRLPLTALINHQAHNVTFVLDTVAAAEIDKEDLVQVPVDASAAMTVRNLPSWKSIQTIAKLEEIVPKGTKVLLRGGREALPVTGYRLTDEGIAVQVSSDGRTTNAPVGQFLAIERRSEEIPFTEDLTPASLEYLLGRHRGIQVITKRDHKVFDIIGSRIQKGGPVKIFTSSGQEFALDEVQEIETAMDQLEPWRLLETNSQFYFTHEGVRVLGVVTSLFPNSTNQVKVYILQSPGDRYKKPTTTLDLTDPSLEIVPASQSGSEKYGIDSLDELDTEVLKDMRAKIGLLMYELRFLPESYAKEWAFSKNIDPRDLLIRFIEKGLKIYPTRNVFPVKDRNLKLFKERMLSFLEDLDKRALFIQHLKKVLSERKFSNQKVTYFESMFPMLHSQQPYFQTGSRLEAVYWFFEGKNDILNRINSTPNAIIMDEKGRRILPNDVQILVDQRRKVLLHSISVANPFGGKSRTYFIVHAEPVSVDPAMATDPLHGGIDLDRGKMNMNVRKDAAMGGVDVKFDPAMAERIRREGFDGMEFRINSIVPITNLPLLLGLRKEEERLALI